MHGLSWLASAGQLQNATMLDLTLFLASSSDSMAWIGEGFPQPLPHNGTVLRQTSAPGMEGYTVTMDDAEADNLVRHPCCEVHVLIDCASCASCLL